MLIPLFLRFVKRAGAVAQSVEQRTENPCVGGSIPPHTTKDLVQNARSFFMWFVYILYSISAGKTYTGYSNNIQRRFWEHNFSEAKGFTSRYRPWMLIRTEQYESKAEAVARERYLKTGRGRDEIKIYLKQSIDGAVSAAAEKE